MHLEVRKLKGKKIYYLAHSYRKAGKVKKIRVYLGIDLTKKELDEKKIPAERRITGLVKALGEIRDPLETVLSPYEIDELETLEAKGAIKIKHLTEDDWLMFSEKFTYDSNAIEGSTVNEKEVKKILKIGEWPQNREKWEISETYGVSEAIEYIRKTKEHLSLELIMELHRIVFKNSKSFAGKFRAKGVEVVVADAFGNVVHQGTPSFLVEQKLKELVAWYNKNKKKYPPLVLAAVVHNQFENIHPFQDGNGRVGRLLLNNILLRHGKPPLNIELKNRREYYAALQAYEKGHNLRPTLELMIKEYQKLKQILRRRKR